MPKIALKILTVFVLISGLVIGPATAKTKSCTEDLILKFGSGCTYKSVTISVSKLSRYRPSNTALCTESKYGYSFYVTVINKSRKVVKFGLSPSASSSRGDGDFCADSAKGLTGTPDTNLLPGRRVTYKEGFTFTSNKQITVQISVDPFETYDGPTVYWTY